MTVRRLTVRRLRAGSTGISKSRRLINLLLLKLEDQSTIASKNLFIGKGGGQQYAPAVVIQIDLQYYCGDAVERPKGLVVGISELMLWFQSSWYSVSAVLSETRGIL